MRRELTQAAISPLYLPYISRISPVSPVCELGMRRELTQAAISPLYLPYISRISPVYLPYVSSACAASSRRPPWRPDPNSYPNPTPASYPYPCLLPLLQALILALIPTLPLTQAAMGQGALPPLLMKSAFAAESWHTEQRLEPSPSP